MGEDHARRNLYWDPLFVHVTRGYYYMHVRKKMLMVINFEIL
jgi:hypothetical protein